MLRRERKVSDETRREESLACHLLALANGRSERAEDACYLSGPSGEGAGEATEGGDDRQTGHMHTW